MIVIFTLLIGCLLLAGRFVTEFLRTALTGSEKAEYAHECMEVLLPQLNEEEDLLLEQSNAKIRINARALKEKNFSGWNKGLDTFGNGYVAIVDKDMVLLPENTPYIAASQLDLNKYPEAGAENVEAFKNGSYFYNTKDRKWYELNGTPIDDNYSYVEFVRVAEKISYADRAMEVLKNVKAIENVYGVTIILRDDSDNNMLYWPEALDSCQKDPEALGIKLEKEGESSGMVDLLGDLYQYTAKTVDGHYTSIVMSSFLGALSKLLPLVLPVMGIILVGFVVYVYWIFTVFTFVRTEKLTLRQQKSYTPKRVRNVSAGFGIISGLVVFLAALYGCTLIGLYDANGTCSRTLDTIFEQMDASDSQLNQFKKTYDNNVIDELQLTADLMERYPELMNKDFVHDVNAIIGSDHLVVFDPEGKEYLTNSTLRGLALGGMGDSSGAFQKLQNGIPSVINEPDPEDPNGFFVASYGVPLSFDENRNYGVLAAYVAPKVRDSLKIFSQDELIDLLSGGPGLIFTADPETKEVIHSSSPEIKGRNLEELGMSEKAIKDHFMDFFRLNDDNLYGMSRSRDNVLYYAAVLKDYITFGSLPFALIAMIPYLLFFLILAVFLLRKYKEPNIEWQDAGMEFDDSAEMVMLPSGEEKRTVDVSQRWNLLQRFRNKHTPGSSAKILAEILALICITVLVLYFALAGKQNLSQSSIFGYVIYGEWSQGFNVFALTAILLLYCLVFFINFVLEFTGFVLNRFLSTKGETIGRLALNIARYVLIIIFFYYALAYLGFDTRAVIASIGLLSFALSLGMKDLVTDVIAGITIVFEGEYQVGDIVEIGGFRGSVVEVGVRSTKLMDSGGNIKIISNRDVKNVLNMTHLNSWCKVEFNVSKEESLNRMEELLERDLPKIGERISEIISGPYYKGVLSFGKDGLKFSVTAECKERDYHRVQRKLTGELNRMLEENQVKY